MAGLEDSDFLIGDFMSDEDTAAEESSYPTAPKSFTKPKAKKSRTETPTLLSPNLGSSNQQRLLRHPSWRVYSVINELALDPGIFCLRDIPVEVLGVRPDSLTVSLKELIELIFVQGVTLAAVIEDRDNLDPAGLAVCLETFLDVEGRQYIEGLLLADRSIEEICEILGCSSDYVLTYSSLFFDTKAFRNNVDKITYVKLGTIGADAINKNHSVVKGIEYLKNKLGTTPDKLNSGMILSDIYVKAYIKILELIDRDDVEWQESAQGWGNLLVKLAQQISKETGGNLEISDLAIRLTQTPAPQKGIEDLK